MAIKATNTCCVMLQMLQLMQNKLADLGGIQTHDTHFLGDTLTR